MSQPRSQRGYLYQRVLSLWLCSRSSTIHYSLNRFLKLLLTSVKESWRWRRAQINERISFKQLERIESELLSYNPAAEKMGANSAGSYRGQLLAAIDRATLVSKVKLGHLNSLSSSTSRLTVFGSYRTITDFIAQLSYDASSVVVLAVTLSAPKDRTYLPNEILEAQMDLDERAD